MTRPVTALTLLHAGPDEREVLRLRAVRDDEGVLARLERGHLAVLPERDERCRPRSPAASSHPRSSSARAGSGSAGRDDPVLLRVARQVEELLPVDERRPDRQPGVLAAPGAVPAPRPSGSASTSATGSSRSGTSSPGRGSGSTHSDRAKYPPIGKYRPSTGPGAITFARPSTEHLGHERLRRPGRVDLAVRECRPHRRERNGEQLDRVRVDADFSSAALIITSPTPLRALTAIVLPARSAGVWIELEPLTMMFCQLSATPCPRPRSSRRP